MTDAKTQYRYQTVIMYEQNLISSSAAAESLEISERQFFRILDAFKKSDKNIESLKYHSHPAWNKTGETAEEKVLKINQDYPLALNSHISWLAWDLFNLEIQPQTVRNILIRNDRYIPFNDKPARAYKKFSATQLGALIQLDTTDGYWLKDYPMLHLILAIDDATRTILGGSFFLHDSTLNNLLIIKEIIRQYGVPALFYTDNDSKFRVIRHGQSRHQNYQPSVLAGEAVTEVRRALSEVGSGLITHLPFHPYAKGKLEKLIRFVQDCFIKNHRAKTIEQLNQDFKEWLAWYDLRNHRTLGLAPKILRERLIRENKVAFRPLADGLDLDTIFAVKEERRPNKYNIFSYQGKEYQLSPERVCYPGKVELRILPDNRIRVFKEKELVAELKN
ncbi:transposase family protein [Candidatus Shapirobacteria bacterium]|nr:transposase family protein [Candidatus Shapirobacteria bacterium]